MRVLGLCSYPIEAAATRYRLVQFVEPLAKQGIELEVSPFISSELFSSQYALGKTTSKVAGVAGALLKRIAEIPKIRRFDCLLVQREAMNFGPAFFERLFQIVGRVPLVLDLDDATFMPYLSPTYGKIGSFLKFFGKTDKLIERSRIVICGNQFIADHVESKRRTAVIVPTVADTNLFCPVETNNPVPILGWIGTHSTYPMLEGIIPALQELAQRFEFVLRIVGSGRLIDGIDGLSIENLDWDLSREVQDFQQLDIGLYPILPVANAPAEWILGKSGFKAIQYFAVGVPFVMSPVGICESLGEAGSTHFLARSKDEWVDSLGQLLGSVELRRKMGEAGRVYSLQNFRVDQQAVILASALREAIGM